MAAGAHRITSSTYVLVSITDRLPGYLPRIRRRAGGSYLGRSGCQRDVFDASEKQLSQNRFVADRDGLYLETIQGDMADLSCFDDCTFALIFHPCSNCFVEDTRPVWSEAFRVVSPGGSIVCGFVKPIHGLFDPDLGNQGTFQLKFSILTLT